MGVSKAVASEHRQLYDEALDVTVFPPELLEGQDQLIGFAIYQRNLGLCSRG